MIRPLCIDLFCGLGGWAQGFLAEGWDVTGFDVERHDYGTGGYPGKLVLQDVLSIDGVQFRNADCIVASPPCQKFSYMAMPWSRAKALIRWYRDPEAATERIAELTALFDACFRIQREACEAAGRFIPLVVENVKGAQVWLGPAKWHYGSFYLWGDVPALMPSVIRGAMKQSGKGQNPVNGQKLPVGHDTFKRDGRPCNKLTDPRHGSDGLKFGGGWWHDSTNNLIRKASSKSNARKAASAMIAKIPLDLARHIARVYRPAMEATA